MYVKHRINLASRLSARGTMLINQYLRSDAFEAYFDAQNEGNAELFLQSHFTEDADLGQRLANYYSLCEKLTGITVKRTEEILIAGLSDYQSYSRAEEAGVMKELDWLRYEYEDSPNPSQKTILSLIEEEIALVREHSDLILGLDPSLSILKQFDELPSIPATDAELRNMIEQKNEIILADELLKRIYPSETGIFSDVAFSFKRELCIALRPHILIYLEMDEDLSQKEKETIRNNHQELLAYLDQSEEAAQQALFCLLLDSAPPAFFESGDFIVILSKIGFKYARNAFESDLIHEALVRLFEFVIEHFDKVRQGSYDDVHIDGVLGLELSIRMHLARSYEYLWETDKAVFSYKRAQKVAYVTQNQTVFENCFFLIIKCYEQHLHKGKMFMHLLAAVNKDFSYWDVPAFKVSGALEKRLELKLVDFINESDMSTKERKRIFNALKTQEAQLMVQFFQGMEEDNISSALLLEAQKMVKDYYADLGDSGRDTSSPDDRVRALLEPLGFGDIDIAEYEKILSKIAPDVASISPYRQLLYGLHKAKLSYLKGQPDCIELYKEQLPKLKYFNKEISFVQQAYWYNEKIRGLTLAQERSLDLVKEMEETTIRVVELISLNYLEEFRGKNAQVLTISELENTLKALLGNFEKTESLKVRQRILNIVWSVLVHRQMFLNRFLGKKNISVPDEGLFNEKISTLRANLSRYYFSEAGMPKVDASAIEQNVFSLRRAEYAVARAKHLQFEIKTPKEPSVLFAIFTKLDNKRKMLALSYMPYGQNATCSGFAYKEYFDFEKVEEFIAKFKIKAGIQWKKRGLLSILGDKEGGEVFGHSVMEIFDGITQESKDTKQKAGLLNVYTDSFLQQFPLEALKLKNGKALRVSENINFVLHKAQKDAKIGFWRGIEIFSSVSDLPNFPYLQYSDKESNSIEQLALGAGVRVRCHRGNQATVSNFRHALSTGPSILHFAIHGIVQKNLPVETSALVMNPQGADLQSALLSFRDILNLDLYSVELVVLSACNSGVGKLSKGAPIQSLAYAFLQAGARFVVASRIAVSDKSTALIMSKFYEELFRTENISLALRSALDFYSTSSSPILPYELASWGIWT